MDLNVLATGTPLAHLGVGVLLGAVHACDADHVMTVTTVSRHGSPGSTWGYGLRWSLGHGISVIAAGTVLAALGQSFPGVLGTAAESAVALVLCVLGAWLVCAALRSTAPARQAQTGAAAAGAGVYGIGALHGLAGAAPVIALIPLAGRFDPLLAGTYLACFSLGVIAAMLLFATLLSGASVHARRCGVRVERALNAAVGVAAMALGARILLDALGYAGAA